MLYLTITSIIILISFYLQVQLHQVKQVLVLVLSPLPAISGDRADEKRGDAGGSQSPAGNRAGWVLKNSILDRGR
jgi:hypothetical protein